MSVVVVLVILCGLAIVLVVITRLFVAVLLSVEGWLYYVHDKTYLRNIFCMFNRITAVMLHSSRAADDARNFQ